MTMKKMILSLLAIALCGTALADGFALKGERRVKLAINWSEASILGYTADEIVTYEQDWFVDQPFLLEKMSKFYNREMAEVLPCFSGVETNYTLELRPLKVNKKGNMTCYAVVIDREGKVVETLRTFKANGGHCGTFLNLVGDGMKSAGKQMAKQVRKRLKK